MNWQSNIVSILGENITFGNQTLKASFKESTRATYSLTNRDCFIEGQCFKGNPEISVGDYFIRAVDNKKYMVITTQVEPLDSNLIYMYASKCNTQIEIKRCVKQRNDDGELVESWETVFSNVYCYKDIATRSLKLTNDGGIDQTIYNIILPHQYLISQDDRVVMKTNINGVEANENYKVDSIDNSIQGIDKVQLVLDLR